MVSLGGTAATGFCPSEGYVCPWVGRSAAGLAASSGAAGAGSSGVAAGSVEAGSLVAGSLVASSMIIRVCPRTLAGQGKVPGMKKASW